MSSASSASSGTSLIRRPRVGKFQVASIDLLKSKNIYMQVRTSNVSNPWTTEDPQNLGGTSTIIRNRENKIEGPFAVLAEALEDVDEIISCAASTKNNEVFLYRHL